MYWYRLERSLGPVQPGRDDRPGGRASAPPPGRRREAHHLGRWQEPQGLPGGHGRGRVLPGDGPGRDGRGRRLDDSLRRVPGRGPMPGPGVPAGDGQHRRLARHPGGLAGAVQGRDAHPLLPPCVPEDPGAGRPPEGDVRPTCGSGSGRRTMRRTPGRSPSGSVACGSGRRTTWTRRWCGRRCWRCAASGVRSSGRTTTPAAHRTSNLVDRLLRRLDYHLYCTQHLHGTAEAAEQGLRGWALIHNFAPSCPETVRESPGLRSPAERLNGMRYHAEWLQNLLVSASLGGYRRLPRKA